MKIVFDEAALADLEAIHAWIAPHNPSAAAAVIARILASLDQLTEFPQMGRKGVVAQTREWVVPRLPYIVVYEVREVSDELVIVAVFHGAEER